MLKRGLLMLGLAACICMLFAAAASATVVGKYPAVTLAWDNTGDFGPNTSGTTTAGWQEAINWCVTNHRDLYIKGGAGGGAVYNASSTINVPAAKNFKVSGGAYILNWTGASGSDMLVFNSAKQCHMRLGLLNYNSGAAAAVRFKPVTSLDSEVSIRDSEFHATAVIGSAAGGSGVVFDTTSGLIWYSEFAFDIVSGFTTCVTTPNSGSSFVYNNVRCRNIHNGVNSSKLLSVGALTEVCVFDVGIMADGSPTGIKGVDVMANNNRFRVNTSGGFPAGGDLVFESGAAGNYVTLVGAPSITNPRSLITDSSTAATNEIRWIGARVLMQSVTASTGTWNYTNRLFPAVYTVQSGTLSNIKHYRGASYQDYGTARENMILSPGDVLQITSTVAPTVKITPLVR